MMCSKLIQLQCLNVESNAKENAMRLDLDLACLKTCEKENTLQKCPVFIAASLCIT